MPRARSAARNCSKPKPQSYHGPGTCTFYGTANSNQMLMEIMGLHLPGATFVNPGHAAARRADASRPCSASPSSRALGNDYTPIGHIVDERAIVNGVVGLHATGGSTNHTLHLIAMARAAGIELRWDDFAELSAVVPLLARVYPNGNADVNHFHAAGGMGFLIRELLDAGPAARRRAAPSCGTGLDGYTQEPQLDAERQVWRRSRSPGRAAIAAVLRGVADPFRADGGLQRA